MLRKMQDIAPAEGSIDWQAKKVQELQKAWRAAADDKSREEINKQIKEANEKLDEMQGKIKAPIGSLKDLKDKMAELQASRELLTNTTDIEDIDAKLKGIEAQIDKLNGKPLQLVTQESKTELEILEAKLAEVNAFIEKYGANSEEGKAARGEQKDLQNQIAGKKGEKTQLGEIQKLTGAVGGILSGIESLGIEIPKGMKDMLSGINGIISIIPNRADSPPSCRDMDLSPKEDGIAHPVILDGVIIRENLDIIGWNEKMLDHEIAKKHVHREQIFLMTVDDCGKITIIERNIE